MKLTKLFAMATLLVNSILAQTVKSIDLEKYSGKWFVIATIPTGFDKS